MSLNQQIGTYMLEIQRMRERNEQIITSSYSLSFQWLLGIQHDDCDYALLNKHLDPQVKAFVKAACCYPETLDDVGSRPTANSTMMANLVVSVDSYLLSVCSRYISISIYLSIYIPDTSSLRGITASYIDNYVLPKLTIYDETKV